MEMKDNRSFSDADGVSAGESGSKADLCTNRPHLDQADQAYHALVSQLRDGSVHSGMFLSMPMLVTQLGFPLAAVREAVKRAESAALLRVLPKRGVTVMTADPEITRDCMELRAMFDFQGARRLLLRNTELPLAALRAAHEQILDEARGTVTSDTQRRAIRTDISLHDALSAGLDGPIMPRLYAENRDRIAVIQNQRPFLADRIIPAMTEHLAILSALEARDVDGVKHAIWDHLRNTLRWWGVDASDLADHTSRPVA